jgi:hypothetical protein
MVESLTNLRHSAQVKLAVTASRLFAGQSRQSGLVMSRSDVFDLWVIVLRRAGKPGSRRSRLGLRCSAHLEPTHSTSCGRSRYSALPRIL